MAIVIWPIAMDDDERGHMSYCFIKCDDCKTLSCPFHPTHDANVSVKEATGEVDETTRNFSRISWESPSDGTVSITVPYGWLSVHDFVDNLVRPLMLAIGYQPESIDDVLDCNERGV